MSNELYHFGVPGMKWGVRRYQNKDGTLTDAGRERYSSGKGPSRRDVRRAQRLADIASAADKGLEQDRAHAQSLYDKAERARARGDNRKADRLTRKADRYLRRNEESARRVHAKADKAAAVVRAKGGTDDMLVPEKVNTAAQVAKVGATVAGSVLLAYGIYKMADMSDTQTRATRARVDQILQECAADPIVEGIRRAEAQKSSGTASATRGAFGPDSQRMADAMRDIGNTKEMFKEFAKREQEFRNNPEMKRYTGSMKGDTLKNVGNSVQEELARMGAKRYTEQDRKRDQEIERWKKEHAAEIAKENERIDREVRRYEKERADNDVNSIHYHGYANRNNR